MLLLMVLQKKPQKPPPAEIKHALELRTEWENIQNEN